MHLRVGFFGDSFVNGAGDSDCLGWAGRICAAACRRGHDVTCYNLGVRGDTSADVRRRWRQEAERRLPSTYPRLLVFSFGVNDCLIETGVRRVALAETGTNARALLAEALRFAPVLMIGPPPTAEPAVNDRVVELVRLLDDACRQLGIAFLDIFPALMAATAWRRDAAAGDGAHPGRDGYRELAELVDGWAPWRAWVP